MNRLRVALDATSLLGHRAGVGVFTDEVVRRLAGFDDVDLRAFAVTWRGRHDLANGVPPGVETAERPMAARPLRWLLRTAGRPRIERWTGPVDVVHGPNFVVPPAEAPRVATVHDLTAVRYPEMCTPGGPAMARAAREGRSGRRLGPRGVRARGRRGAAAFPVDPDRGVTIANGVRPAPDADPARGRSLARAERYVLALGTIEPRKDLPGLVTAFDAVAAEVPDVDLVVAGADGWGVDAFEAALRNAARRERIHRLGEVSDRDRDDLLAGAAVLAYPSLYEGFGMPPLEAMSLDVPVVSSDAGRSRTPWETPPKWYPPGIRTRSRVPSSESSATTLAESS